MLFSPAFICACVFFFYSFIPLSFLISFLCLCFPHAPPLPTFSRAPPPPPQHRHPPSMYQPVYTTLAAAPQGTYSPHYGHNAYRVDQNVPDHSQSHHLVCSMGYIFIKFLLYLSYRIYFTWFISIRDLRKIWLYSFCFRSLHDIFTSDYIRISVIFPNFQFTDIVRSIVLYLRSEAKSSALWAHNSAELVWTGSALQPDQWTAPFEFFPPAHLHVSKMPN